jgi:hypothetical protein
LISNILYNTIRLFLVHCIMSPLLTLSLDMH